MNISKDISTDNSKCHFPFLGNRDSTDKKPAAILGNKFVKRQGGTF